MNRAVAIALVTISLLICERTFAADSAMKCLALFAPTAQRVFDELSPAESNYIFSGGTFETHVDELNWFRRRRVRNLVQRFNFTHLHSPEDVTDYAVQLNVALFAEKEVVDRWIFQTRESRVEESAKLLISERLIRNGLLRTWRDTHDEAHLSRLRRVMNTIGRLLHTPLGQIVRIPFRLPRLTDSLISDELMYLMIRDGYDRHANEVRIALKSQGKIEAYNTFQKLYSPVFFSVLAIAQWQTAMKENDQRIERQVEETVSALKSERASIERFGSAAKQEEYERAVAASIEEFQKVWGELPTPAERLLIEIKIKKALHVKS